METPTPTYKEQGKVMIFSAPSGAGKTTIVNHMLDRFPKLEFSISATSRPPRGQELHGREYHFMTQEEFQLAVRNNNFIEWEEVYEGTCYGTLRSEMERIWKKGNVIVFDVDVKGGISLKKHFGENALAIFVMPPSVEELERRLRGRGTDAPETITKRIAKAEEELAYASLFDQIIVNDNLGEALREAEMAIRVFTEADQIVVEKQKCGCRP